MVKQPDKEFLTAEEAREYLGVTRRTLDRYASAGRLQKYRRGIRSVIFKREDVEHLKRELESVRPEGSTTDQQS